MKARSQLDPQHRAARSRLAKLLDAGLLLKGSLVTMARTCGKPNCKCTRGHKHVSLYLAVRHGNVRKMIYVPPALEDAAAQWVETYRQVEQCLDDISAACLERFQKAKRALRDAGDAGRAERRARP
jgi:hypothetical protein